MSDAGRTRCELLAFLALLLALVPACSSDGESSSGSPNTGTPTAFCQSFYEALCSAVARCGCGDSAVAECRSFAPQGCTTFDKYEAAVRDGGIVYDSAAGARLIAKLETDKTCASLMTILGMRAGELASFGGVYNGTKEPGASCTLRAECRAGVCDLRSGATEGQCVGFVDSGQACDTGSNPRRVCVVLAGGPDSDDEFESSMDSLFCVPSSAGAMTGSCRGSLENGQACNDYAQCVSKRCTGTCEAKLAAGESCSLASDCESSDCSGPSMTCAAKVGEGSTCTSDSMCERGRCTGLFGSETCNSAPSRPLGDACTASNECQSDVCSGGKCIARLCREYVHRTF